MSVVPLYRVGLNENRVPSVTFFVQRRITTLLSSDYTAGLSFAEEGEFLLRSINTKDLLFSGCL